MNKYYTSIQFKSMVIGLISSLFWLGQYELFPMKTYVPVPHMVWLVVGLCHTEVSWPYELIAIAFSRDNTHSLEYNQLVLFLEKAFISYQFCSQLYRVFVPYLA